MKISPRVFLMALAVGLSLIAASHAVLRWRSFAQFKERKKNTPTPTPRPPVVTPPEANNPRPRASAPEIEMVYIPGGSLDFRLRQPHREAVEIF